MQQRLRIIHASIWRNYILAHQDSLRERRLEVFTTRGALVNEGSERLQKDIFKTLSLE
jgi:hypothetical protein